MNVLSIQSHVAYGHVGNTAAAFPLERLGFEVWRVNTVQFSNHTGYPVWRGRAFPAQDLAEVLDGMAAQGAFAQCDAVLSGYLGAPEIGRVVLDAVTRVRAANPQALYLCDPVMGDRDQGFFVSPEITTFMADEAVPAADLLAPNQFELEQLAGAKIATLEEALAAAQTLLDKGPKAVVVTSLRHRDTAADQVEMLAVTRDGAWRVATPFLPCDPAPNGAGDAFSALFLAHYLRTSAGADRVSHALEQATAAIFAIVDATYRAGTRELRLIDAQDAFVNPRDRFSVERLN